MFPTWGSWYDSQYCSNSSRADWWSPGTTCQYGEEGGFLCACDYNGWVRICNFCLSIHNHDRCNFDQHSVGYIPIKDRLLPIFFFVLWVAIIILCCLCCCRCCCANNKNRWRTLYHNWKYFKAKLIISPPRPGQTGNSQAGKWTDEGQNAPKRGKPNVCLIGFLCFVLPNILFFIVTRIS